MNGNGNPGRLAEMRRAFDQAFAGPLPGPAEDLQPLIAIRAGGEALALRLGDITGVAKCRRIVPVLSRISALLGVSGMRGALVPVYSLAALLDFPRGGRDPQWLALAMRESPIGLAFDEFEGQMEVSAACLYSDAAAEPRRHLHQLARIGPAVRGLIDVPSIVEAIRKEAGLRDQIRSNS